MRLTGDKVVLRPFAADDITDAYLGWLNDPEITRWSNQRFRRHDRANAGEYLASFAGTDNLFLAVEGDGATVGTITAYRAVPHGTADLGILIGARGQGFGQDAWKTLMAHLFATGTRKVTAGTLSANLGMVRIAERSGMVLEGMRRAQEIAEGEPRDLLLYARFAA